MLPVHAQLLPSESLHLQSVVGEGLVAFIHRIADKVFSRKFAVAEECAMRILNLTDVGSVSEGWSPRP
jgi:hypothetical protein